jgi:hypothetical protein
MINRLPSGTSLEKYEISGQGEFWVGFIGLNDDENIPEVGPIRNADLGTVVEHLLILKRRKENDESEDN